MHGGGCQKYYSVFDFGKLLCIIHHAEYNQRVTKFLARLSQALQKNKSAPEDLPDSHANFGPGSLINQRYRLDEEIGRGGMGIVFRAHDIPNNRDVAVKIINMDTANALTLQQFSGEVEITARLNHPHIVAVYETGTAPLPFIVMELLSGISLDQMRGFTYSRIVDVGHQICDALEYIHNQGFVYRDLKPGNVILEKRGFHYFVKLLDFGLARPRGEDYLPTESSLAGSTFYLAPELISGQPADIASDLYALGVTLYEMLTGRVPFSDFNEQKILSQHLEEPVPPPSHSRNDIPPALESIVLRLLEKNPQDRFASAQDVSLALDQVALALKSAASGNLPQTSADMSGYGNDIVQITQLFESSPLVTLLNCEDALALAVGAQLTNQFADGAWLVNLELVSEPTMVLQTVASILGIQENPNRPLTVSLIESLREKNLLLLLGHCELFPAACAQLTETILSACPDVRILATSQQPLNISDEKCYR